MSAKPMSTSFSFSPAPAFNARLNDVLLAKLIFWYGFLHVAHDDVRHGTAWPVQEIANAGRHNMIDVGIGDNVLENVREVLEDNDAARTGVLELVLEFPRRVQRVDVNNDQAGPENAAHRDRVLQDVRQHDRDALAACQPELFLQEAGKAHRQLVQIGITQRLAHVRVGRVIRVSGETMLEQVANRSPRRRWDFCRHAFRIRL